MDFDVFSKIVNKLEKAHKNIEAFNDLNLDVFDIECMMDYSSIITILLTEIYGEEGEGWIGWFCYENDFGRGDLSANDEENNKICYDVKSLWEYLEQNHKK